MTPKPVVFFLSTGRCGTQWVAETLNSNYSDLVKATHEPVRGSYRAKQYLRAYENNDALLSHPEIKLHLDLIKETVKEKSYVETGWPCYPAIPLMRNELAGRMKIVHLIRHPVHTAMSLATHNIYGRQDWISSCAIDPFDSGVLQNNLRNQWSEMTMFEKCLFWWTEINLYALELREKYRDISYFRLRFEDLINPRSRGLGEMIDFLELPQRSFPKEAQLKIVDKYRKRSTSPFDWTSIYNYPVTLSLAQQFGYNIEDINFSQMKARYYMSFKDKLKRQLMQLFLRIKSRYRKLIHRRSLPSS